jgi:two-component system, response regulator YesN
MNIVVVEDEYKTRKGLINLIKKINSNYIVVGEAEDGKEGFKIIIDNKPDVVFLDIKMPEMNGLKMLELLQKENLNTEFVILSAHKEFNYAQKAIKFGVFEYVLKPVTLYAMRKLLDNLNDHMTSDIIKGKDKSLKDHSLFEGFFNNLISGNIMDSKDTYDFINKKYRFDEDESFILLDFYDNSGNLESKKTVIHSFINENYPLKNYCCAISKKENIVLIQDFDDKEDTIKKLENGLATLLTARGYNGIIVGCIDFSGLKNIGNHYRLIRENLNANISLKGKKFLKYDELKRIKYQKIQYPISIEQNIIKGIYSKDNKMIEKNSNDFISWWKKDIFSPKIIIESYISLVTVILETSKEIYSELLNEMNQQSIFSGITNSMNSFELEEILNQIINKILILNQNQKIYSLNVMKTINYISTHYNESITLDEISDMLQLTPEYLSTLFCKEVGINFVAFVREIKINKAKELLINTNLKIYEIAERVGFSDTTYFCRVFKELTGFSTGEYQKINKKLH